MGYKKLDFLKDCVVKTKNNDILKAILKENEKKLRKLVGNGEIDVNEEINGWTPLIVAILVGNLNIVKYLIESGADIDKATSRGFTPLMMTVCTCNENNISSNMLLLYLLDRGVDVNKRDIWGVTALDIARNIGNIYFVKKLVDNRAQMERIREKGYKEILHDKYAKEVQSKKAELIGNLELLANCAVEMEAIGDIFKAILEENEKKLRKLIGNGEIDINQEVYGWTPLIVAILVGNLNIVKYLIESGADIDKATSRGFTPLMMTVDTCNENNISSNMLLLYLLNRGVDINKKDAWGVTALDIACNVRNIYFVKKLVDKGAQIDDELISRISRSREKGYKEILDYLRDQKNERNKELKKVKNTDISKDDTGVESERDTIMECEKYIREKLGNELLIACAKGNLGDIKKLVEEDKADINYIGEGKITPLIVASAANSLEKVRYLLEHGADVNARVINEGCTGWREYKNTPLMMACANENKEMIRCMVEEYKADVNIEGAYKNTPLMIACNRGNIGIILYLLNSGADPDRANGVLKTVLDFASWEEKISKIIKDNINKKNKCLYDGKHLDILQGINLKMTERKRKEDICEAKSKRKCKGIPRENNSGAMLKK